VSGDHLPVELLGPAALGLATPEELARVRAHVDACGACGLELARLRATAGRLSALDASPALLDDLLADGAAQADAVLLRVAAERRRGQRVQQLLAAAAAVAVLLAGVVSAVAVGRDEAPRPLEVVAVQAAPGVSATATLVPHTWGMEIALVARGLADGAAYSVEVTTDDGRVLSAGAFLGTGERTLTCSLNSAVLRDDARSFVVRGAAGTPVVSAEL
jgi:anti-sigma factor RsiW